jgi:hypothetical protein
VVATVNGVGREREAGRRAQAGMRRSLAAAEETIQAALAGPTG